MSMRQSVQLLRDYAERGDEAAFRELVSRYIDLVYSAALRRLGGDAELARDVTQTVFADLARKARLLRGEVLLGGWLHHHTGFVAATLVRSERRRQTRERQAAAMNTLHHFPDPTWRQLAPVLDESMDALEAPDRQAIVLRFFEQRDFRAVGVALGISDDAAQKRVSRALEKLRVLLVERGVTMSAALLTSLLTAEAVSAAPVSLAATVSQAALVGAATGAGVTFTLLKLMTSFTSKLAIGAATLAVGIATLLVANRPANDPANIKLSGDVAALGQAASLLPAANVPVIAAISELAESAVISNNLVLHIVTADTGVPIPNVPINYWLREGTNITQHQFQSTRLGVCEVPCPRATVTELRLTSQMDGFADTRLQWQVDRGEKIPGDHTLRLTRAVSIGGLVLDADKQPVSGAHIRFNVAGPASSVQTQPESHIQNFDTITGTEGRWSISRIAPEIFRFSNGMASHPDLVDASVSVSSHPEAEKQLLAGTHVFQLGRAVSAHGLVVDGSGQPVSGAKVRVVSHELGLGRLRRATTEADGTFSIADCKPGQNVCTAEAEGFAATTMEIQLRENSTPIRMTLQRDGKRLRLRVVDKRGMPIPEANVRLGHSIVPGEQMEFSQKTGPDGRLEWENAPDRELLFNISAHSYLSEYRVKVRPDGEEHEITLLPSLTISGTVRDAAKGEPLPHFHIITGWPVPASTGSGVEAAWSTMDRFRLSFAGGKFHHLFEEPVIISTPQRGFVFKFEADGYSSFVTRTVEAGESEVQFDVTLRTVTTNTVTVLLPDGGPATGAEIGLVSPGARLQLSSGGFSKSRLLRNPGAVLRTDEQGRFRLSSDDTITRVIAVCPGGYGEALPESLSTDPTLRLQPWGRIEGTFLVKGRSGKKPDLALHSLTTRFGSLQFEMNGFWSELDAQGGFAFDRVPPGRNKLVIAPAGVTVRGAPVPGVETWTSELLEEVEVRPGETTNVVIGGKGYEVTLRLGWPAGMSEQKNWSTFAVMSRLPSPPMADAAGPQLAQRFWFRKTDEGGLTANDVRPGRYLLSVLVVEQTMNGSSGRIIFEPRLNLDSTGAVARARAEYQLTVPAEPATGTLDLAEIALTPGP
jgi:RNA polymerase sigma factor (sigma-70 family)